MGEPHLKARPIENSGFLQIEVDQAGYELLQRYHARAKPLKTDSAQNFNEVKARIDGLLLAGAIQMGWKGKK